MNRHDEVSDITADIAERAFLQAKPAKITGLNVQTNRRLVTHPPALRLAMFVCWVQPVIS